MPLPDTLRANAWGAQGPLEPSEFTPSGQILTRKIEAPEAPLRPDEEPTLADWRDEEVGWGLVLPENPALSPAQRASAIDAPGPIQQLRAHRGDAPVLRYDPDKGTVVNALRRYYDDGAQDPDLVGSPRGTARGCLPYYLLIYGSPGAVPWELQYDLNHVAFVGRLDLAGDALSNYVTALVNNWAGAPAKPEHALVWAADHGASDITSLMRRSIAAKVYENLASDEDIGDGAIYLDGAVGEATQEALRDTVSENHPALIVTTSHGCTYPLEDPAALRARLGLLVDNDGELLDTGQLLARWQPGGAIWYAHACCSAGTAGRSAFDGLFEATTDLGKLLEGLAEAGPVVSPLPRALLGAPNPLRAFAGHVEPTFDWTLQNPRTDQILTKGLRDALYRRLYRPSPIGFALEKVHSQSTQLKAFQARARQRFQQGRNGKGELLALQLTATDLESLVVLGDPAAMLPSL